MENYLDEDVMKVLVSNPYMLVEVRISPFYAVASDDINTIGGFCFQGTVSR